MVNSNIIWSLVHKRQKTSNPKGTIFPKIPVTRTFPSTAVKMYRQEIWGLAAFFKLPLLTKYQNCFLSVRLLMNVAWMNICPTNNRSNMFVSNAFEQRKAELSAPMPKIQLLCYLLHLFSWWSRSLPRIIKLQRRINWRKFE